MPKLNFDYLLDHLRERLGKLQRGEEVSKKDIEALLDPEQIQEMNDAWAEQEVLRKTHKRPKTDEQAKTIGWKTKLEVRIEAYEKAMKEAEDAMLVEMKKLQHQSEVRAARVFMDAWSKAVEEGKRGESAVSIGNIALQRAGFSVPGTVVVSKRDKEVWDMEDRLRKRFEAEATAEEKEQLEILREHEKYLKKQKR